MERHSEQSATSSSWSRARISWAGIKGLRLNWELWFRLFLAEHYFSTICLTCPEKVTWICRWWIQFCKICEQMRKAWFTANWLLVYLHPSAAWRLTDVICCVRDTGLFHTCMHIAIKQAVLWIFTQKPLAISFMYFKMVGSKSHFYGNLSHTN